MKPVIRQGREWNRAARCPPSGEVVDVFRTNALGLIVLSQAGQVRRDLAQVGHVACATYSRIEQVSSPQVISSTQCNWISMPQWARIKWAISATLAVRADVKRGAAHRVADLAHAFKHDQAGNARRIPPLRREPRSWSLTRHIRVSMRPCRLTDIQLHFEPGSTIVGSYKHDQTRSVKAEGDPNGLVSR
jgi:hypothetical protein